MLKENPGIHLLTPTYKFYIVVISIISMFVTTVEILFCHVHTVPFRGTLDFINTNNKTFKILWYTIPDWVKPSGFKLKFETCLYKNCEMSIDNSTLGNSDLVLFDHTTMNIKPPKKSAYSKWAFVSFEVHHNTRGYYSQEQWNDKFDWTMTYRLDSEGFAPYGKLIVNTNKRKRNYTKIWNEKTNNIAWVVSHCKTPSRREVYVRKMQKFINVDVFGKCGKPCNWTGMDCVTNLSKKYKFVLSFENSICEDYVTEKLFRMFNGDNDFVPIVRGAPNIKNILPEGSYISALDYRSPRKLATYIKTVASNKTLYLQYLETKHHFLNVGDIFSLGMCSFCTQLNKQFENPVNNSVVSMKQWMLQKQCIKPTDI